jgi:YhcH/YjgK/YiaL family protein
MITDLLANAHLYRNLHPGFAVALDFLATGDPLALPLGKTSIDGERLFALVQDYAPKPLAEGRYEAHRRYWDLQFVARGAERMGWANLGSMTVDKPYDAARDVGFFHGRGDLFHVSTGGFAIFGPQDVHMPGLVPDLVPDNSPPLPVHKIVFKIEWDE